MGRELLTIGHSHHPSSRFVELLASHGVTAVCDVRSTPYSRRNPQFNRETVAQTLEQNGMSYVFLGRELGARREEPECYVDGQAKYDRIAESPEFKTGLERLLNGIRSYRVALMCAEADPLICHRTILVCRHMRSPELSIAHILPDGELEHHQEAEARLLRLTGLAQGDFFESGDVVEQAYDRQGDRIAYRRPSHEEAASEGPPH